MIMGIISVCTFWIPLLYLISSVPLGIIATVFGVKGRRLAAQGQATNPGQAQAGIILGSIGLVLCAINLIVGIAIVAANR
ncbi:MAG: hypothetical protein DLM59_05195 [Pseudonocardiales bacterium]|nr:MAG: hypothetical protein DLM59_05195 [Pseudonocardiales bacterium]